MAFHLPAWLDARTLRDAVPFELGHDDDPEWRLRVIASCTPYWELAAVHALRARGGVEQMRCPHRHEMARVRALLWDPGDAVVLAPDLNCWWSLYWIRGTSPVWQRPLTEGEARERVAHVWGAHRQVCAVHLRPDGGADVMLDGLATDTDAAPARHYRAHRLDANGRPFCHDDCRTLERQHAR
jgi:hypothetical protein